MRDVLRELRVASPEQMVAAIRSLKEERKMTSKAKRLIENLQKLVVECSGVQIFEGKPDVTKEKTEQTVPRPKEIWRWVVMLLKKQEQLGAAARDAQEQARVCAKVREILCTKELSEVEDILRNTVSERNSASVLITRLKQQCGLSSTASNAELLEKLKLKF